jgi:hypothetical protein
VNALPLTNGEICALVKTRFGADVCVDFRCLNDKVFVYNDADDRIYSYIDGRWFQHLGTTGYFYESRSITGNDTTFREPLASAARMHSKRLEPLQRSFLRAGVRIESKLDWEQGLSLVRALDEVPLSIDLGDGVARARLTLAQLEMVDTSVFKRRQHVIVGAA